MKYEISGFNKLFEHDNFEHGIQGASLEYWIDYPIAKDTKEEFIAAVKYFLGDDVEIEFNTCEEDGRIDVQLTENDDGNKPSPSEYYRFKNGDIDLWAVTYTAYVQEVVRKPVKF